MNLITVIIDYIWPITGILMSILALYVCVTFYQEIVRDDYEPCDISTLHDATIDHANWHEPLFYVVESVEESEHELNTSLRLVA